MSMLKTIAAASALAAGLAISTSAIASADTTVNVPGIGSFSYGNDGGVTLNNYGYRIGYTSPNGSTSYKLTSSGTANGFSSYQKLTVGPYQSRLTQSYGTAYEGTTCVLCSHGTVTGPTGTYGSETNVSVAGIEQETTTPFGSFSWPKPKNIRP